MTNETIKPSLSVLEVRDRIAQAESRIRVAIARELENLAEAGISPDHISIDLVDVTAAGDQLRRAVVGQVRVHVEL